MVDDVVAGAVAALVFILGLIAWSEITGASPVSIPISVTLMAVISIAITSLLVYDRMNQNR